MDNKTMEKDIPKILIADDIKANRFTLRDIIAEMGYQPILTENGAQALKVIERFPVQLIISDIAMPVMDGYEFCKIVKSDPKTRSIPIIFISAFDNPNDIIKGFELQGEDYITKPFIPEVVKARVKLHLKLYESNRELSELNHKLQVSVNEQLRQMEIEKKNVLYALLRVARENSFYDEKHMERVSYNCRILAEAMQLSALYDQYISDFFINTIEIAAPLCDLGNVAISTHILQKKGSLTDDEAEQMQKHTTIGAGILKDIQSIGDYNDFIKMAIEIAQSHHENWDGSGYPEGMKGEDIPLAAQIVAVASEYCALTENRAYRGAYDEEETFKIMEKEVGTKLNPDIFQIMHKIHRQLH